MPIDFRSQGPDLLVITYRGVFSDDDYEAALARMARELTKARSERRMMAFVSVGTSDSNMTPKQRQRSTAWLKEQDALLRAACIGQAVVVPGTIQRGVLTAILWMGAYPVPIRACATEEEADRWIRSLLQTGRPSVSGP